jgi:hypothetical protein
MVSYGSVRKKSEPECRRSSAGRIEIVRSSFSQPMPLILALLLLLLCAPAAGAATVELRTLDTTGGGRGGELRTDYRAIVRAPGDERNVLRVAVDGALLVVRDAAAPAVAGPGCRADGDAVACPLAGPGVPAVFAFVEAGGGDDELVCERLAAASTAGPGTTACAAAARSTVEPGPTTSTATAPR